MTPLLAMSDTVWLAAIAALAPILSAVVLAVIANKHQKQREEADKEKVIRDVALAKAVEEKAAALAKVVDVKLEATHTLVNSNMEEFKKVLAQQAAASLEIYKTMMNKAQAFDNSASVLLERPPPIPDPSPVEVKVVNDPSDPAPVKLIK